MFRKSASGSLINRGCCGSWEKGIPPRGGGGMPSGRSAFAGDPMNPTLAPKEPRSASSLFAPIAFDLDETESILRQSFERSKPGVDRLLQHLHHYKGKRLRPALLLLTALACGRVAPAHHLLAAVLEMIHTATLVHDDVLDSASVRRHVPTVNAQWGNQSSILLGDYLFTHAFH